jgi:hypothetical protein
MWSKLISSISFIMQAILVIAAVLVFSFFDPFNIFGTKKRTLKDTPITVESIKGIGELITAEYYGEVLGSLREVNVEKFEEKIDRLAILDSSFASAMADMQKRNLEFKGLFRKRKIEKYFDENYSYLREDRYFGFLMDYLQEELNLRTDRLVFKYFYEDKTYKAGDINHQILEQLPKKTKNEFVADNRTLKQQIVMIGRGAVKAGIKFDNFNENNFYYSKQNHNIYLIGLHAEILSCDINPWFIPEKQVKGFELILYTGRANDPKYMSLVKKQCVDKLREAANKAQILDKALLNAHDNLKAFFSLLLGDQFGDVIFTNSKAEAYLNDISVDGKITESELPAIDSLLNEFKSDSNEIVKPQLKSFMDSLMKMPFKFKDSADVFNCFSSLAYELIKDNQIDSTEYAQLKNISKQLNHVYRLENFFFDTTNISGATENRKKAFSISLQTIKRNTDKLIIQNNNPTIVFTKKANQTDSISKYIDMLK